MSLFIPESSYSYVLLITSPSIFIFVPAARLFCFEFIKLIKSFCEFISPVICPHSGFIFSISFSMFSTSPFISESSYSYVLLITSPSIFMFVPAVSLFCFEFIKTIKSVCSFMSPVICPQASSIFSISFSIFFIFLSKFSVSPCKSETSSFKLLVVSFKFFVADCNVATSPHIFAIFSSYFLFISF